MSSNLSYKTIIGLLVYDLKNNYGLENDSPGIEKIQGQVTKVVNEEFKSMIMSSKSLTLPEFIIELKRNLLNRCIVLPDEEILKNINFDVRDVEEVKIFLFRLLKQNLLSSKFIETKNCTIIFNIIRYLKEKIDEEAIPEAYNVLIREMVDIVDRKIFNPKSDDKLLNICLEVREELRKTFMIYFEESEWLRIASFSNIFVQIIFKFRNLDYARKVIRERPDLLSIQIDNGDSFFLYLINTYVEEALKDISSSDRIYFEQVIEYILNRTKIKLHPKEKPLLKERLNILINKLEESDISVKERDNVIYLLKDINARLVIVDDYNYLIPYGVNHDFSKKALIESAKIIGNSCKSTNFRPSKPIFSVDPNGATEIDDAFSLTKLGGGRNLVITYLADVPSSIDINGALAREASIRKETIYLPHSSISMFPMNLVKKSLSLKQGKPRKAILCQMEIDSRGRLVDYKFSRDIVVVRKNFSYMGVNNLLNLKKTGNLTFYEQETKRIFEDMIPIAKNIRGMLNLKLNVESDYVKEEAGLMGEGLYYDKSSSIVETLMILTNHLAAKHMANSKSGIPFSYRVHEGPNSEAIAADIESLESYFDQIGIGDYKKRVELARKIISSTSEAYYSIYNIKHFGLDLKEYCHFTSSIRRFQDILNQYFLMGEVYGSLRPKEIDMWHKQLPIILDGINRDNVRIKEYVLQNQYIYN